MKNKYIKNTHLNERKFREIVRMFSEDLTVSSIARLSGISILNISNLIQKIRIRSYELVKEDNPLLTGQIEVDESYFVAKRVKGKGGRGFWKKTYSFWFIKTKWKGIYRSNYKIVVKRL